jgi:CelD/BcsL family acetyltransferase involved in cellulose biosynthesis
MYNCELIDNVSRLQQLSCDWERLWRADSRGEVFQSFAWAWAWWQSYGEEFSLCTLAVFEENELIGIVPLVKKEGTIEFLGQTQSDYCDVICEDGRAVEVLCAGIQRLLQVPGWKKCRLQNIRADSRLLRHWSLLPTKLRRYLQVLPGETCRTILLNGNSSVLTPLIHKRHTRRRVNKLRRAGVLTFRHIETKAEAQIHVDYMIDHQLRRHTLTGRKCPSEKPRFRKFLHRLVEEFDPLNSLRVGVLELDGGPLAWHFSFQVNGKLTFYQQAFDVEASDYSPGEVLIHELLRYVQDNVTRELDFTRGDEPFKARFTTDVRKTYLVYVDPPQFHSKLRQLGRDSVSIAAHLVQHAKRSAKRHARMFSSFRSARLRLSGLLARVRYHQQNATLLTWVQNGVCRALDGILHQCDFDLFVATDLNVPWDEQQVSQISVRRSHFADLVDLAREHPEIINASELPTYRKRLKLGDRLYMIFRNNRLTLLAWTSTREPVEILGFGRISSILPAGQYTVLYECWDMRDSTDDGHYRAVLRLLRDIAWQEKLLFAVCCPATSVILRHELFLQRFQPMSPVPRLGVSRPFRLVEYCYSILSMRLARR